MYWVLVVMTFYQAEPEVVEHRMQNEAECIAMMEWVDKSFQKQLETVGEEFGWILKCEGREERRPGTDR
jgi:hypothetical protein